MFSASLIPGNDNDAQRNAGDQTTIEKGIFKGMVNVNGAAKYVQLE